MLGLKSPFGDVPPLSYMFLSSNYDWIDSALDITLLNPSHEDSFS